MSLVTTVRVRAEKERKISKQSPAKLSLSVKDKINLLKLAGEKAVDLMYQYANLEDNDGLTSFCRWNADK